MRISAASAPVNQSVDQAPGHSTDRPGYRPPKSAANAMPRELMKARLMDMAHAVRLKQVARYGQDVLDYAAHWNIDDVASVHVVKMALFGGKSWEQLPVDLDPGKIYLHRNQDRLPDIKRQQIFNNPRCVATIYDAQRLERAPRSAYEPNSPWVKLAAPKVDGHILGGGINFILSASEKIENAYASDLKPVSITCSLKDVFSAGGRVYADILWPAAVLVVMPQGVGLRYLACQNSRPAAAAPRLPPANKMAADEVPQTGSARAASAPCLPLLRMLKALRPGV